MRRLPEVPAKPQHRISLGTAFHMILVAAIFDALQFGLGALLPVGLATVAIPVAGIPVAFAIILLVIFANATTYLFSFLTFFTWFTIRNVSLGLVDRFAIKRFIVWVFTTIAELLAGAIPATTIGVIATILIVAEEDRQKIREWDGKLRSFEKIAWALLKSGGNPEVAIIRLLRSVRLDRAERVRLQQLKHRSRMAEVGARNMTQSDVVAEPVSARPTDAQTQPRIRAQAA